ncbi:MAG: hypothetical protein R3Y29_02040 [bacterium]
MELRFKKLIDLMKELRGNYESDTFQSGDILKSILALEEILHETKKLLDDTKTTIYDFEEACDLAINLEVLHMDIDEKVLPMCKATGSNALLERMDKYADEFVSLEGEINIRLMSCSCREHKEELLQIEKDYVHSH